MLFILIVFNVYHLVIFALPGDWYLVIFDLLILPWSFVLGTLADGIGSIPCCVAACSYHLKEKNKLPDVFVPFDMYVAFLIYFME